MTEKTDAEIAAAYEKQMRALLQPICDTINQAKAVDKMLINVAFGPELNSERVVIQSITIKKVLIG